MRFTKKGRMRQAIARDDIAAVTRLLDAGFSLGDDSLLGRGNQAVLQAACAGRRDILELFIRRGADFVTVYNDDALTGGQWQTLLHVAAARGHKDVAALLLDSDRYDNALLNRPDSAHNTALHCAAAAGHGDIVRLLLDRGFNPDQKGANGKLPIGLASQGGHAGIVGMLEAQKAAKETPAPAVPPPQPSGERWRLVSPDSVSRTDELGGELKDEGYRITDLFNFASRERIRIVHNLKTRADAVETVAFDDLRDARQVQDAFAALQRLGGKAGPAALETMPGKPRRLPPPAPAP